MTRIARKEQKIFAENATNNGVFGSLQANDPTISSDPDTIQGRPAFALGWDEATYSAEKLPPLEEFQALQYLFSRQLAYLFQEGIPEWNASTTYYKGSLVKTISGTDIAIFSSLIDSNVNNQTSDTTKWAVVLDTAHPFAYDSAVVHTAGTETITGDKEFTGTNNTVATPAINDDSQKIANTEWVKMVAASYASGEPRDITELADFNGTIISNSYMNLSESWKNFEEIVVIMAASAQKARSNAYRMSTYWLDYMLSNGFVAVLGFTPLDVYFSVSSYTSSNPSTDSDLHVEAHGQTCYVWKVLGINRKSQDLS